MVSIFKLGQSVHIWCSSHSNRPRVCTGYVRVQLLECSIHGTVTTEGWGVIESSPWKDGIPLTMDTFRRRGACTLNIGRFHVADCPDSEGERARVERFVYIKRTGHGKADTLLIKLFHASASFPRPARPVCPWGPASTLEITRFKIQSQAIFVVRIRPLATHVSSTLRPLTTCYRGWSPRSGPRPAQELWVSHYILS
jgi:hypothetical protein